jgi:hypothetical protein
VAATLVVVATAACGSGKLSAGHKGDLEGLSDSGQQYLDYEAMQVNLPIERFGMNTHEEAVVDTANQVLLDRCFDRHGVPNVRPYEPLNGRLLPERTLPDWRFGTWNTSYVEDKGIDGAGWGPPEAPFDISDESWEAVSPYWDECLQAQDLEFIAPGGGENAAPLTRLRDRAGDIAEASAEWAAIANEWRTCVEADGWEADHDSHFAVVAKGPDTEAHKAAVVAAAECADSTGSVAAYAELVAREENRLIEENLEELEAVRSLVDEQLARARAILAEEGIEE